MLFPVKLEIRPRRMVFIVVGMLWIVEGMGQSVGFCQTGIPSSKTSPKKPQRQWNWKTGDEVYQQIKVAKRPKFQVQGLLFESKIRYTLLSHLTMSVSPVDNSLTIQQRVDTTKLEEADDLSKVMLTKLLKELNGKTFTIQVGSDGEVKRIEGLPKPQAVAAINGLDFRGAMLNSLIDEDGWKELTKATLFTPQQTPTENGTWKEPMSHSWGGLGGWQGQSAYKIQIQRAHLQSIEYEHHLRYIPPPPGQNNLPFKIISPMFRAKQAQGILLYDSAKGRLSTLEERFHVMGQMKIQLVGQNIPMMIEERQQFQLKLFDKKPASDKR